VVRGGAVLYDRVEVARLTMRAFSDAFLERYIATAGAAVTASVGSYQLERIGIHLFSRIEGDHFTVLGLPLLPLLESLREQGFVA
jgi:septum formation protein